MKRYVNGGVYSVRGETYFGLVSPTGASSLPYIYISKKIAFVDARHHAHTYLLSDDNKSITLDQKSWEAACEAPQEHTLSLEEQEEVELALAREPIDLYRVSDKEKKVYEKFCKKS